MTAVHKIYIALLAVTVLAVLALLTYTGYAYYHLPLEERFFHPDHIKFKPSGIWGHGLGIAGSLSMIFGIVLYMLRKRVRSLSRLGLLRHWLEFHIFLCTLGPVLVLFHTAFKFGGIVAVSFWSMVAVFLSGIIGRFIYIQIPRTIEGREMSLQEIQNMKTDIGEYLSSNFNLDKDSYDLIIASTQKKMIRDHQRSLMQMVSNYLDDRRTLQEIRRIFRKNPLPISERKKILALVKNEISLNRRISRLVTMQNLFKYWHVAHLPFAIVMIVIMVIHVAVTIVFGYRWVF